MQSEAMKMLIPVLLAVWYEIDSFSGSCIKEDNQEEKKEYNIYMWSIFPIEYWSNIELKNNDQKGYLSTHYKWLLIILVIEKLDMGKKSNEIILYVL